MRILLILFLILPSLALAQLRQRPSRVTPKRIGLDPALQKGMKVLGASIDPVVMNCEQNPSAPWCQDLFKAVCEYKKSENRLNLLSAQIDKETYLALPPHATLKQKNDASAKAIQLADTYAYQEGVTLLRDEVRKLMGPAKGNVISLFSGSSYPAVEKQKQMAQIVQSIKLKTGGEYVAGLIEYAKRQSPNTSQETLRERALSIYTSICGSNGLEVNAFYEKGDLVLCPGLVYSLADYKANSDEIKAALLFTISHEITHSIDYIEMPEVYDKMKACYEKVTKNANIFQEDRAAEITADYYGAHALAKYLYDKGISGVQAVRIVALATDGFCSSVTSADDYHPSSEFRINQTLAKTPLMRKVLGCADASKDDPFCALNGEITE